MTGVSNILGKTRMHYVAVGEFVVYLYSVIIGIVKCYKQMFKGLGTVRKTKFTVESNVVVI